FSGCLGNTGSGRLSGAGVDGILAGRGAFSTGNSTIVVRPALIPVLPFAPLRGALSATMVSVVLFISRLTSMLESAMLCELDFSSAPPRDLHAGGQRITL